MVGRVGNNQLMKNIVFSIQQQLSAQEQIFEQISSNKRILGPSSDPVGASRAMAIRDQLSRNEEYDNVVKTSDIWTNSSVTALDNAIDSWKRVNELGISAADGTKTEADRLAIAEELEQILQHLVQIGNTSSGNRFIFGGSKTDAPPFSMEQDASTGRITGVFYQGDDFQREIKTKDNGTTVINIPGSNAGNPKFSGAFVDSNTDTDAFGVLIELRDKLLNNDIVGLSGSGGVLEKIETAGDNLTSAQVLLGGTQERLDLDRNHIIEENADLQQFLSEIEDADVAKLILDLNNAQNVYEAALATGGRLVQTGLLNFI